MSSVFNGSLKLIFLVLGNDECSPSYCATLNACPPNSDNSSKEVRREHVLISILLIKKKKKRSPDFYVFFHEIMVRN